MDSLPVELLRLIFENCDAAAVQHLRLTSRTLATIGYEYLIPARFTALEWRDDVKRLHAISNHDQLRTSIESITFTTFNFVKCRGFSGLDTVSSLHRRLQEDGLPNGMADHALAQYYGTEARRRSFPCFTRPFSSQGSTVEEAFKNLPKLKTLEVTYRYPFDMDSTQHMLWVQACQGRDRVQACKNMNAIVSAIRHAKLSYLTIDHLPLELFKVAEYRKHWFDCALSFAGLSRLDLTVDTPRHMYPRARFRAINGLGRILELSPNLTHLSLGFQNLHEPFLKPHVRFQDLVGDFTFGKLTDLKLGGITCTEPDLRSFLLRHSSTLERLRLGGKGIGELCWVTTGGINLYEGTWRSFLTSLHGKLPKLERFHIEGYCEAGDPGTASHETYKFVAVTDDDWEAVSVPVTEAKRDKSSNCLELERYLLRGGEYPKLVNTRLVDAL